MNFKQFSDFIIDYSKTQFGDVNEPLDVAKYGMVEEWGEFVGEYKRLVRDNFSLHAVDRFDRCGVVEWADTVAYWVVHELHSNFGVIKHDAPMVSYFGNILLPEKIKHTSIWVASVMLPEYSPYTVLAKLLDIGSYLPGGTSDAFDLCTDKLAKRASMGTTQR